MKHRWEQRSEAFLVRWPTPVKWKTA